MTAWQEGLAPELVAGASAALAVVEHVAASLPGGVAGYAPRSTRPAVLADAEAWHTVVDEKGVKVFGRKCPGGPPYAVGVTRFSQSVAEVAAFLFDPANMHRWNDELCEKGEYYGEEALGIKIVSERNLVILTVRETLPDGTVLIGSHSVADAHGPPPPKGTVRAHLLSGGGVVVPVAGGGCDVMFMTQVDFGGGLPQRIVTMVSRTSPLSLAVAKDIMSGKSKK